jgi:phage internal scaffolding protein
MMKFRKHFDYDVKKASEEAEIDPALYGPSQTIQSMAEDADINVMMRRFGVTGQLPQGVRVPTYGDFIDVGDYRSALHAVMEAQDNFMALDPKVRARFSNDPQEFLAFVEDPKNINELRAMGLAKELTNGKVEPQVDDIARKVETKA